MGAADSVQLHTVEGKRFVELDGQEREVVVVEVAQLLVRAEPGVYVVGTGSNGVAETFCLLGGVYALVMLAAALSFRIPAPEWVPAGWSPPTAAESSRRMIATRSVDADRALRTPQFYLLWIMLCFNVTAGIGVCWAWPRRCLPRSSARRCPTSSMVGSPPLMC